MKFSPAAFMLLAKKRKIKPGTKNTDLEGMGPAEKRMGMNAELNPFTHPQKPTDGDKKKKKKSYSVELYDYTEKH
jgi:hypothetical protein